jgi:hypothetical protein
VTDADRPPGRPTPRRQPGVWTGDKTVRQRVYDTGWDLGKAALIGSVGWLIAQIAGIVHGHPGVTALAVGVVLLPVYVGVVWVLAYKAWGEHRWLSLIAALGIVAVVVAGLVFAATSAIGLVIFGGITVVYTIASIIWFVLQWRQQDRRRDLSPRPGAIQGAGDGDF